MRREQPPHHVEDLGRRTLERKDRLLFVADREQRAAGIGPAAARHELGRYSLNDLPLLRTGVLRLVDQDVIDAEVELVEHPGGRNDLEKRQRAVDQVIVVEQRAPLLFHLVAVNHFLGDGDERARSLAGIKRALTLEQRADTFLFGQQSP